MRSAFWPVLQSAAGMCFVILWGDRILSYVSPKLARGFLFSWKFSFFAHICPRKLQDFYFPSTSWVLPFLLHKDKLALLHRQMCVQLRLKHIFELPWGTGIQVLYRDFMVLPTTLPSCFIPEHYADTNYCRYCWSETKSKLHSPLLLMWNIGLPSQCYEGYK